MCLFLLFFHHLKIFVILWLNLRDKWAKGAEDSALALNELCSLSTWLDQWHLYREVPCYGHSQERLEHYSWEAEIGQDIGQYEDWDWALNSQSVCVSVEKARSVLGTLEDIMKWGQGTCWRWEDHDSYTSVSLPSLGLWTKSFVIHLIRMPGGACKSLWSHTKDRAYIRYYRRYIWLDIWIKGEL